MKLFLVADKRKEESKLINTLSLKSANVVELYFTGYSIRCLQYMTPEEHIVDLTL